MARNLPHDQADGLIQAGIHASVEALLETAQLSVHGSGSYWNLYELLRRMCTDARFRHQVNLLLGLPHGPVPVYCFCSLSRPSGRIPSGTHVWVEALNIGAANEGNAECKMLVDGKPTGRTVIVPLLALNPGSVTSALPDLDEAS